MKPSPKQLLFPFVAWLLVATSQGATPTPAPALRTAFKLPLADQTMGHAVLLVASDANAWLVYATDKGKLGFWLLIHPDRPIPPDPVPPPPPPPQRLTIAIVEDPKQTTQQQRDVLADQAWRDLVRKKHNFVGILPVDLIDKRTGLPPPHLKPYLDHAKTKNLPWVIFTDSAAKIIWEGPVPATPAELEVLVRTHGG